MGLHCTAQAETYGLIAAIYADGDLAWPGQQYAANLECAAKSAGWPLALQLDTGGNGTIRRLLLPGRVEHTEIVQAVRQTGPASAETLTEFLAWAAERAPTERHMLVVYGHGTSASGRRSDGGRTGRWPVLGISSGPDPDPLQPEELARAIQEGIRRPVDLLVLDSCYGASLEIAWEMREVSRFILASPGRLPARGLHWQAMLESVADGEEPEALACEWAHRGVGLTALGTDDLEELRDTVAQFSTLMVLRMRDVAPLLSRALSECRSWGAEDEMRDLSSLCTVIATSTCPEVAQAADDTIRALDRCILSSDGQVTVPFQGGLAPVGSGTSLGGFNETSGWGSMTSEYHNRLRHLLRLTGNDRRHDGAAA